MPLLRTREIRTPAVFAMIHVPALPGTPRQALALPQIVEHCVHEARVLCEAGFDGLLIENMHDVPYLRGRVGPEIVAAMTAVGCAIRHEIDLPLGVQILAAANREALAAALACEADFVRVENFVFAHVADEGLMAEAEAGGLLRYRRQIGAEHVAVVADVKKKHSSHAITADIGLPEAARAAEFFDADGVVVTGSATAEPASPDDVRRVREAVAIPLWIGSGLTPENLADCWPHADGLIVGSYLKRDGRWSNPLDAERIRRFCDAVERLRAGETQ